MTGLYKSTNDSLSRPLTQYLIESMIDLLIIMVTGEVVKWILFLVCFLFKFIEHALLFIVFSIIFYTMIALK